MTYKNIPDEQVGGDHYKTPQGIPQHWDLSIMYQWDGFQHCITKYIMRWKDKYPTVEEKIQDLKKARHFLDKYIANAEAFLPTQPAPTQPAPTLPAPTLPPAAEWPFVSVASIQTDVLREPAAGLLRARDPSQETDEYFQNEGYYGDWTILVKCKKCKETFRAHSMTWAREAHACTARGTVAHPPV